MKKLKKYSIIIAVDEKHGIWKNGELAWSIKEDMHHFKALTTTTKSKKKKNAVIMGRKTWESIPKKFQPLPWRINCILSSSYDFNPQVIDDNTWGFNSFEECHKYISKLKEIESIFIIGWSYLYNLVLDKPCLENIYLTRVYGDFSCDVFFSDIPENFKIVKSSEKKKQWDISYQMFHYRNSRSILWKLLTPAIILWIVLFLTVSVYLIYSTFTTPSWDGSNISIIQESSDVEVIKNNDTQSGSKVIEENAPLSQDIKGEDFNIKISSKWSFKEKIEEKGNITIHFPITEIAMLDDNIKRYIKGRHLKYKILLFNKKNSTGEEIKIVLDYKILTEDSEKVEILFSDIVNGEEISQEKVQYKKEGL